MKKIEYLTPEVKVVELKGCAALLVGSGETVDNPPSTPGEPGDY